MTVLSTESELQSAYRGEATAAKYIDARFRSELNLLLHERQVGAVQHLLNSIRHGAALEIAPGPGRVTRDLKPIGRLACLEYNLGMIDQGKAACAPHVEWNQGNAFELPFGQEFDFVYSYRFIRHFKLEDRQRLYGQVKKVLRPGGHFLFDAVNRRLSQPLRDAHPEIYPIYDELYDAHELVAELKEQGFSSIKLNPVQKWYHTQYHSEVFVGPRSRWLNRMIIRGLESLPRSIGLEWIVTCRLESPTG